MIESFSISETNVGLPRLPVHPEVTKHLALIAEKWHPEFPCLGDAFVIVQDVHS